MIASAGLGDIVAKLARVQPDAPALVDGVSGVRYSAAELDLRRRKLANLLRSSGLRGGRNADARDPDDSARGLGADAAERGLTPGSGEPLAPRRCTEDEPEQGRPG